jgi:uncharacterized membrane protein YfcA
MTYIFPLILLPLAIIYSSVGHGGASGYLAIMALSGFAPESMKPTALTLNILVSSICMYRYIGAGYFSWKIFLPFALISAPFAFLGGGFSLSNIYYKPLVGVIMLYAACHIFIMAKIKKAATKKISNPSKISFLGGGAGIGFLSGLTGVGGGIFLSPLLVLMHWSDVRTVSGIAAAFIFVNSCAGLAGHINALHYIPASLPFWIIAVGIGALVGTELGTRYLSKLELRYALAIVLILAGFKMIFVSY